MFSAFSIYHTISYMKFVFMKLTFKLKSLKSRLVSRKIIKTEPLEYASVFIIELQHLVLIYACPWQFCTFTTATWTWVVSPYLITFYNGLRFYFSLPSSAVRCLPSPKSFVFTFNIIFKLYY